MRKSSSIRLTLLTLFCTVASLACCQQMGSIVGEVRVVHGNFPEQILVNLQARGATVQSTYTDGAGRFGFNAVYTNVYHVIIADDRYQPVDEKVELKPDIQPVYILQINLMPRDLHSTTTTKPGVVSAEDFTKKYPKEAVKEFDRGTKRQAEGNTDDAIQHFKKALKIAPTFAMAHNGLGAAFVSKSDFVDAQRELAEAIRLDHSHGTAYFNMANLMLLTSKLVEANEYLRQGFFLEPESAFGFFVQGTVFERTGKLPEAEASLQRALQLDPKMPRPHLELVNLYLREQRSTQAVAELHNFLQVAPKDPLAPKAREVLERLKRASSKQSQP